MNAYLLNIIIIIIVTIEDTTPPQHPAVPDTKDVEMKTDCLTSAAGVSLAHSNMQAIVGKYKVEACLL